MRRPNACRCAMLFVCLGLVGLAIAEEGEEAARVYQRKSISFFEGFLQASEVTVPTERYDAIVEALKIKVIDNERFVRFDRNPIPASMMEEAKQGLTALAEPTIQQVSEVIGRTFNAQIIRTLDIEREVRTRQFVSEQERVSFLTDKARELGVTADDMARVMDAAHVIVPYVDGFSRTVEKDKDGKDVETYRISGGMLIYRVDVEDQTGLTLIGQKTNVGVTPTFRIQVGDKPYDAFGTAVESFLRGFEVLVRDVFKLSYEVAEAHSAHAMFSGGRRVGIRIDDKYDFIEHHEDESGAVKQKRVGHGLARRVRDEETDLQVITGRPERGMIAMERPRSPIEVRVAPGSFPLVVRGTDNLSPMFGIDKPTAGCLGIGSVFLLDSRMQLGYLGVPIPQAFLTLSIYGAGLPLGSQVSVAPGITYPDPRLVYLEVGKLGLMKRFYMRRLAIGGQVAAKIWQCNIASTDTLYTRPSTGPQLGFELSPLLEFVLTPDINLGTRASYGIGKSEIWLDPTSKIGVPGTMPSGLEADLGAFGLEVYVAVNPKIW